MKYTQKGLEYNIKEAKEEALKVLRKITKLEVENKKTKSETVDKKIKELEEIYKQLLEEGLFYRKLLLWN